MTHYRTIDSPIGLLTLAGHDQALTNLRMVDQTYEPSRNGWSPNPKAFNDAVDQLERIFCRRAHRLSTSSSICGAPSFSGESGRRC